MLAVAFLQGFDQRVGKCVLRGKECGVAGLRGGFELRKDTTTLQAQEMTKTVVKEKSYISPHKKILCAFVRQKVCVMGRCKKKKIEGPVRQEKLREVFSKVSGARFDKKNVNRVCIAHVVSVVPKPTFILFFCHFCTESTGLG